MEPVPLLTVGDLKSELSRWSNETPVTFYSPLKEQEFSFTGIGRAIACSSLRSMNFQRHRRRYLRRDLAPNRTRDPSQSAQWRVPNPASQAPQINRDSVCSASRGPAQCTRR